MILNYSCVEVCALASKLFFLFFCRNEFELFKQKHESEWNKNSLIPVNDDQARAKWKKISKNEKEKYFEELKKLKNNYIVELTEYIKHCPPNKLAHYVALIASQQQQQPVGAEQVFKLCLYYVFSEFFVESFDIIFVHRSLYLLKIALQIVIQSRHI